MAETELVARLPMYVNLGDLGSISPPVIGFASAFLNDDTGTGRIEIKLDREGAELLKHLTDIADLKAIGFAGIMKKREISHGR